jgi:hypothetical protein
MATLAADAAPVHLADEKIDNKQHDEQSHSDGYGAHDSGLKTYEGQGTALEKRLMRKIDFRLIPPLCAQKLRCKERLPADKRCCFLL